MFSKIRDSYSFFKLFYNIYYTDFNNISDEELDNLKTQILDNGSLSIKFMQWYITKLINTEEENNSYINIIKKFEDIFDNCPYHSDEDTNKIFEESFGCTLNSLIKENSLERIASGSIGQVYRAELIDGRKVAIKVRHPNVAELKDNQMILVNLINSLQNFAYFRNNYSLFIDIQDFIDNLNLQIDFRNEVFNNLMFSNLFRDYSRVVIPKIYYYSNDVIISEYCDGIYYHEIENQYIKRKIAINFLCFNIESAVFKNFMHADLHSRNWKVEKNDKDSRIIIYDFGICFRSVSSEKNLKVWEALSEVNIDAIHEELEHIIQGDISLITVEDLDELNAFKNNGFDMNILLKKLKNIFTKKNIRVKKLFMNFMIWASLIEEQIKEADCFIKDEEYNESNLAQSQRATVIAYCETANCYPILLEYYKKKYDENRITDLFNNDCDLVFSDIED